MSRKQTPLFVHQQAYRRRRLADAARLLPILGAVLFVLPLLWIADQAETRTAAVMVYIFVSWAALIGLTCLLSHRLREVGATGAEDQEP